MTGIQRIEQTFKKDKKIRLMTHVVGGYPDLAACAEIICLMAAKGADLIEVQLPFSDPIADGPVIVQANHYALKNGITTDAVLDMLRLVREKIDTPLLIMSYLNPVFVYGTEAFLSRMIDTGLDGLIVPDYPMEDPMMQLAQKCNRHNLALVPLIAPTTGRERVASITRQVLSPFVYAVLRLGVTGRKTELDEKSIAYLRMIREVSGKYVAGGFGIRTKEQVAALCEHADCAIIGSALLAEVIKAVQQKNDPVRAVERFLNQF